MRKTLKQLQGESDYWRIKFINEQQRAEAAEAKLAERDRQDESRWNTHDGIARPIGLNKDDLVYLRMKRQEMKLPYPAGMINWKHDGSEFDVLAWASVNAPIRPAPAVSLAPVSNCLSFFASVIKSGESWSETCQRDLDAARETLRNI
ncbi:hypothetical protein [Pantoea sp.]|uniref:hypothetical protein n=1 Tax=Pantoea sp. TaxID=69393 RepID=UPI0028ABFDE0|nr:hypothetical protein [Pantoea sp.]